MSSASSDAAFATVEELIDDAQNGRMFILTDDATPGSTGDLIVPGQMATPDAINFMAVNGRGLVRLAITGERAEALGLALQPTTRSSRQDTAFAVSIEAKEGVTTGISARDRARTIATAIEAANGRDDIVSPGHVFPIVTREGGVLVRAGRAEAAVDIARLAGLNASGVLCEILHEDGSMARLAGLMDVARRYGLKVGTIQSLIEYRRKHDHFVERAAEGAFQSDLGGHWKVISYRNKLNNDENMVLQKGSIDHASSSAILVRMHNLNVFQDTLAETGARSGLLGRAMRMIADEGCGLIVLINRFNQAVLSQTLLLRGGKEAELRVEDLRDYGLGAQILADLGVHDIILLTNSHRTPVGLAGYGLNIVEQRLLA